MLLQQLGKHLVFPAQFIFKLVDALFFYLLGVFVFKGKGSGSLFKKLLVPTVKYIRLQVIFVAKIRYRFSTTKCRLRMITFSSEL